MKEKLNEDVLTEWKDTGANELIIEKVIERWDKWCNISQYHEDYTLYQNDLSVDNFTKTSFKTKISKEQAHILIEKLNLKQEMSPLFRFGSTWR